MILLIDAGNSRVKWAIYQQGRWLADGVVAHDAVPQLAEEWRRWPLTRALASSVAEPQVGAALQAALPCPVQWVRAQVAFGDVTNHYRQPAEQGADRWLAVLAARQICAGDVVVACAGTALTVEALTAEGDYLGGCILPGYRLMLASLARGTANLDRLAGEVAAFPQGTADALATGVVDAMVGAIERMCLRLAEKTGRGRPQLLLTGGDAAQLAPWLAEPVRIVDNLVLMGLLRVAGEQ